MEVAGSSETSLKLSTSLLGITFKKAALIVQRCDNSPYVLPYLYSVTNIVIKYNDDGG
jgi:hypothetical protein